MALTITKHTKWPHRIVDQMMRSVNLAFGEIDCDDSYPTGGYAFDLSPEVKDVKMVAFETVSGYLFEYDSANKKVKVYEVNQPVDENGTATYTVTIKEVGDGTDLASVTGVGFLAIGF